MRRCLRWMRWLVALVLFLAVPPTAKADPITLTIIAVVGLAAATGISVGLATGSVGRGLLAFLFPPLASFLTPKPKFGSGAPQGREISVRQSNAPWQIVYGLRRVGGVAVPVGMAGANNEFLYLVYLWCYGGPDGIEEITSIYFGDELAINGSTPVAKYTGFITVENHLGTDAQVASALLLADLPSVWLATDKFSGHAYTVLKLKWDQDKFSDFSIENVRAQLKGRKVLGKSVV